MIVCVLKSGGDYTVEYVERLAEGVKKHSGQDLVCLSDIEVPVERIPLEHNWPGWFAKIELFRLVGPVVYFDLDTIIQGDIRPLLHGHRFTMLRCFLSGKHPTSGMMAWDGDYSYLMKRFAEDPERHMNNHRSPRSWGDQGFITHYLDHEPDYWQDKHPGMIASRKVNKDRSKAAVICYHGSPRPHQTGWAP